MCPCHGSEFDPNTGAVVSPPAPHGLTSIQVAVDANGSSSSTAEGDRLGFKRNIATEECAGPAPWPSVENGRASVNAVAPRAPRASAANSTNIDLVAVDHVKVKVKVRHEFRQSIHARNVLRRFGAGSLTAGIEVDWLTSMPRTRMSRQRSPSSSVSPDGGRNCASDARVGHAEIQMPLVFEQHQRLCEAHVRHLSLPRIDVIGPQEGLDITGDARRRVSASNNA